MATARTCPSCKSTYTGNEVECPTCRVALVDELQLQMSDTMESTRSAVMRAVASPVPTPGPIVRSNSTPGRLSADIASPAPHFDGIVGACLAERYEVTRKVGEGGMGAVYEARHLKIGKR